MKENFEQFLPLLIEAKEKSTILNQDAIDKYKNHKLFKHLSLTDKEITGNILSLEKIIIEDEKCKSNGKKCFSDSNYHMGVKREKEKITFFVYYCNKMQLEEKKYHFKKNFIYNYYRNSDISNVQLKKEYFDTSDYSLQKIVDAYKRTRDDSNSHGMYIHGNFGVGKTYLSFAFANDLASEKKSKVCFVFLPEYINIIKKSFSDIDTKYYVEDLTNAFKDVDVLFIDDIGAEYSSEWFYVEYFLNILNQRMVNNKKTFFSSNLSLNELEKSFNFKFKETNLNTSSSRLMDRIRTLVNNEEYLLKGTNRRYLKKIS